MTDNVTNMLLAQRLMARLHPPETGGMPAREPPDWMMTLRARRNRERQRSLGEQFRWDYWQDRIREQQGWMEPYRQLVSRPEQAAGTFESDWPSNHTQPVLPPWLTDAQQLQDFQRESSNKGDR